MYEWAHFQEFVNPSQIPSWDWCECPERPEHAALLLPDNFQVVKDQKQHKVCNIQEPSIAIVHLQNLADMRPWACSESVDESWFP